MPDSVSGTRNCTLQTQLANNIDEDRLSFTLSRIHQALEKVIPTCNIKWGKPLLLKKKVSL